MKLRQIESLLCLYRGASAKRMEAIKTQLMSDGLLTKGGRGPYAPDANERDAVMFMLAVGGADTVAESAEAAMYLAGLTNRDGKTLAGYLTDVIAGRTEAHIHMVRLLPISSMAEVMIRGEDGGITLEHFCRASSWADPDFVAANQGAAYVGPIGHIGGGVIAQMAIDFADREEGGWTAGA